MNRIHLHDAVQVFPELSILTWARIVSHADMEIRRTAAVLKAVPEAQPIETLPATVAHITGRWYRLEPNKLGLEELMLGFDGLHMELGIMLAGQRHDLPVGLDGVYRLSSQGPAELPTGIR